MLKRPCTTSGNLLRSDRHWSDPWWILLDMALCVGAGIVMLFIDIYDGNDSKDIREHFSLRMQMTLDEVPLYLRSVNYKEE
jgi:hypothetical protein